LKVFSENLSKLEERAIVIAKREAHDKAVQDGGDADEATMEGDTAAKRLTFKFKLTRSWNKARKHAPAAAAPAVVADPLDAVPLPAILPEKDHAKRIEYLAAISAAYGRIMAHRVFKDILTALPNPIQTEDSGECGAQAAFDDAQCSTALTREKLYRSGCNFFWLNHLRSLMPGVPLSIDRTMEIVAKYWQSPTPFKGMVAVEARADGGLPRTHDLLILSPEEITHSYLLAIDGSIARGDSEDILLQWRKHCLSVCFEYHDLSGQCCVLVVMEQPRTGWGDGRCYQADRLPASLRGLLLQERLGETKSFPARQRSSPTITPKKQSTRKGSTYPSSGSV
jgi:hypothetical protein